MAVAVVFTINIPRWEAFLNVICQAVGNRTLVGIYRKQVVVVFEKILQRTDDDGF
jgi:hypothetical protein